MNNPFSDVTDAAYEQGKDVVKLVRRDLIKGIAQTAKQQIAGNPANQTDQTLQSEKTKSGTGEKTDPKKTATDPVTGKPSPSKKTLGDLQKQVAQLSAAKIKKVREELEKQRLKIAQEEADSGQAKSGTGPELPKEKPKEKDNAVQSTLRGSKNTGEFKGLIGG